MSVCVELRGAEARAAAEAHLKDQLSMGLSLSRLLLERVGLANGTFSAVSAVPLGPGEPVVSGWGALKE